VEELQMDSSYSFTVMAFNKLGESGHSGAVRAATASMPPAGALTIVNPAMLPTLLPNFKWSQNSC
jgi:hypothetical protein